MIKKVNKIKNLGLVFADYTWDSTLPDFKQVNLVYGWNGCGKTTFSRLFDVIGGGVNGPVEYEVEDLRGGKFKQGEHFPRKIRVFNQDYIQKNIRILEGEANAISVLLGEENQELIDQIARDTKLLEGDPSDSENPGKNAVRDSLLREKSRKEDEYEQRFTEIAKVIGAAIGGNALRTYRRGEAKNDFSLLAEKEELIDSKIERVVQSVKQESMPAITAVAMEQESATPVQGTASFFQALKEETQDVMGQVVNAEAIDRLSENSDISEWVDVGLRLHEQHASTNCEYCLQIMPSGRTEELRRHFNEADRQLKSKIDDLIAKLRMVYKMVGDTSCPSEAQFYPELKSEARSHLGDFAVLKQGLLEDIGSIAGELKNKKIKVGEALVLGQKFNFNDFFSCIENINTLVVRHNKTTADFEQHKKESTEKVKRHYLSTIFDNVNVIQSDISRLTQSLQDIEVEIAEIQRRIAVNMAQVSSQHRACDIINEKLQTFLGHGELSFAPRTESAEGDGEVLGYRIIRNGDPAQSLSEGEKTAIAFIYFIVHLGDQDFEVKDGVIVVDDPVSSFDSNFLYQAFSFLKNAVREGAQVFILTHSFEFLRLLINWRKHDGGAGYYMIKNYFSGDSMRCASIAVMDKELHEYESEYHYLFKVLKQFHEDQDNSIAKSYPIPNIARKVWETFLTFSVPNGGSSYSKLEHLKKEGHDAQKLDAIYKFTNDQSHITGAGFNPTLVPEAVKIVSEIFEMMKIIAPRHFKIIDEVTS